MNAFEEHNATINPIIDDYFGEIILAIVKDEFNFQYSDLILNNLLNDTIDLKLIAEEAFEDEDERIRKNTSENILDDVLEEMIDEIQPICIYCMDCIEDEIRLKVVGDLVGDLIDSCVERNRNENVSKIRESPVKLFDRMKINQKHLKMQLIWYTILPNRKFLKIMIKCFFNLNGDVCIPILHGGYAVELYNAEYKTQDIDIKIIPKNNTPIEQIVSNFKYFVNHHITYASYIRGLNEIDSLNGMRINPLLHQLHEKLEKYFASQIKSIDIIHKKIKEFIIFKIAVQYYL